MLQHVPLWPESASTTSGWVDALYIFLLLVSAAMTTLIFTMIGIFAVKYRKRPGHHAEQIEGSTILELGWSIIPFGVMMIFFVWGALIYFREHTPPPNSAEIYTVAKQWMWKFEHMTVGATSPEELNGIIRKGGRRGEIYARLKSLADTYGDLVRQRYPDIPRRVSGYNLNFLLPENGFHVARALVGSEGTCVTILEATCRLVESPPERVLLVVAYPDIYQAADHVPDVMAHKPIGLEGIDDLLTEYTRRRGINAEGLALLPPGGGWLLVEFGAQTQAEAEAQARGLMDALSRSAVVPNM